MDTMHDVIVLGAGIAGSTMAGALAELGWDALVLERGVVPRHKVCGEFLSPESKGSLAALGLEGRLNGLEPAVIERVRLIGAGGKTLEFGLPDHALGLSRYKLDEALLQSAAARGADVWLESSVLAIGQEENGYRLEVKKGGKHRTLRARAVIGAWGRHPRQGLIARRDCKQGQGLIGLKTQLDGLHTEPVIALYLIAGGYIGVAPVGDGRTNIAAILDRKLVRELDLKGQGWLREIAACLPELDRRLEGGRIVAGSELAAAPIETNRHPEPWGLVPHIGDAALVVPPLCGDGMAMALRSVELCAPMADAYLNGRMTMDSWKRNYRRALIRQFAGPARWGNALQTALCHPALAPLLLRLGAGAPALVYRVFQATRLKGSSIQS